jgi:hypothetical protein
MKKVIKWNDALYEDYGRIWEAAKSTFPQDLRDADEDHDLYNLEKWILLNVLHIEVEELPVK